MIINLNMLPKYLDEVIDIPEDFYTNMDISSISPIHIKGIIKNNLSNETEISLEVEGTIKIPDAITNEIITYPLAFSLNEVLEEHIGENEKYFEKSQNTLDIIEFLWENIVLEVPTFLTNSSGTQIAGEGWQLNGESGNKDEIDPRMEKLSDIFKGGE